MFIIRHQLNAQWALFQLHKRKRSNIFGTWSLTPINSYLDSKTTNNIVKKENYTAGDRQFKALVRCHCCERNQKIRHHCCLKWIIFVDWSVIDGYWLYYSPVGKPVRLSRHICSLVGCPAVEKRIHRLSIYLADCEYDLVICRQLHLVFASHIVASSRSRGGRFRIITSRTSYTLYLSIVLERERRSRTMCVLLKSNGLSFFKF